MDKRPRSTTYGPIKVKCLPVTTEQDENLNNTSAPSKEESGFTTVKKRSRKKPIIGTRVNKGLRVAKPPVKVFISRLAPDTTCQEVCTSVKEVFDTEVDCEPSKTRHPEYISFVEKVLLSGQCIT